jgi:hypothetical protein
MVAGLAQYDEQSDESSGSFEIPPAGDNCCYRLQWSAVILHGEMHARSSLSAPWSVEISQQPDDNSTCAQKGAAGSDCWRLLDFATTRRLQLHANCMPHHRRGVCSIVSRTGKQMRWPVEGLLAASCPAAKADDVGSRASSCRKGRASTFFAPRS